jgi:peptide methionine sulfoxide reductase MsrA
MSSMVEKLRQVKEAEEQHQQHAEDQRELYQALAR